MEPKRNREPNWAFWGFCLNCIRAAVDIARSFFG